MVPTLTMGLRMTFLLHSCGWAARGVLAVFVPARPENAKSLATPRGSKMVSPRVRLQSGPNRAANVRRRRRRDHEGIHLRLRSRNVNVSLLGRRKHAVERDRHLVIEPRARERAVGHARGVVDR